MLPTFNSFCYYPHKNDNILIMKNMMNKNRKMITLLCLILALGMCIYGAVSGEAEVIFTKAVNICMECIGLG